MNKNRLIVCLIVCAGRERLRIKKFLWVYLQRFGNLKKCFNPWLAYVIHIAGNRNKVQVEFLRKPGLGFSLLFQRLPDAVILKKAAPLCHSSRKVWLWPGWLYYRFGYISVLVIFQ